MSVVATYKVYENQSWLDISNQIYGTVIYAFELAVLNNTSPSDFLKAGQEISYNPENQKDLLVLKSLNSIPATALINSQIEIPTHRGIGTMQIGNTFKAG